MSGLTTVKVIHKHWILTPMPDKIRDNINKMKQVWNDMIEKVSDPIKVPIDLIGKEGLILKDMELRSFLTKGGIVVRKV